MTDTEAKELGACIACHLEIAGGVACHCNLASHGDLHATRTCQTDGTTCRGLLGRLHVIRICQMNNTQTN